MTGSIIEFLKIKLSVKTGPFKKKESTRKLLLQKSLPFKNLMSSFIKVTKMQKELFLPN